MREIEASSSAGALYALGAYGLWGFAPIYWKWTGAIPATELLGHRVLWSLAVAVGLVVVTRNAAALRLVLRSPRSAALVALAALLLAINWLTFIYAVQTDRVIATSLGYYINPLFSVLLGLVVLRERLTRAQGLAVALAAAGVAWWTVELGELPWIAVVLAGSFGLYGLVRKTAPAPPLAGFALEMLFLAPLAAAGLLALELGVGGTQGAVSGTGAGFQALVAASGLVTAGPLLCFASAAQRLPLSTLGMFQYLAPSLTLALAVGVYGEPFTRTHAVSFGCVWAALALFTLSNRATAAPPR